MAGWIDWFLLYACLLLAASSVILWVMFGRDEKRDAAPQGLPPAGLTPAELGFALDGDVSFGDVVALLPDWAERGFVKFDVADNGQWHIIRLNAPGAGAAEYEKYLFSRLFECRDSVAANHLAIGFRPVMNRTRRLVVRHLTRVRPLFTATSMALKRAFMVLTAVPVLSVLVLVLYRGMGQISSAVIGASILGTIVLIPVFGLTNLLNRWRGERRSQRRNALFRLMGVIVLVSLGYMFYAYDSLLPVLAPVAAASTLVCGIATAFMGKRTEDGLDLQCAAEGLREFILTACQDDLLRRQQENPRYFFQVLPHAYMLGLSARWASMFEGILEARPRWLSEYETYDGEMSPIAMVRNLNRQMSDYLVSMTMVSGRRGTVGSGAGVSGGGGGFSGGGGGGGGGGSW